MRDLNSLVVFVRVAEQRSFTEAARLLGLTASAVSKAITRLEAEMGVKLLHRTTRSVNLTAEGTNFLDRCRSILTEVDEAEAALGRTRSSPQGRLRVQMPVGFGRRVVVPALPAFSAQYPGITVDAELSDRIADVAYEALDAAIVIGPIGDTRLIARRLCDLHFIAVASPDYLDRHGRPAAPDDLDIHHCLAYVVPQFARYRDWLFERNGEVIVKSVSGHFNVNNAESLLEAAVSGQGIVMLSTFITAEAVRRGELEFVLPDWSTRGPQVSLVYLPSRHVSARVRAFIDFMTALLPADLPWDNPVATPARSASAR
ncbi:LysR family transcriptional regulator [soil metagenome]